MKQTSRLVKGAVISRILDEHNISLSSGCLEVTVKAYGAYSWQLSVSHENKLYVMDKQITRGGDELFEKDIAEALKETYRQIEAAEDSLRFDDKYFG